MSLIVQITLELGVLVARLRDGRQVSHEDADELEGLLAALGVEADNVRMPDWRAGDLAPTSGQTLAVLSRI